MSARRSVVRSFLLWVPILLAFLVMVVFVLVQPLSGGTVTVAAVNDAPLVQAGIDQTAGEGSPVQFDGSYTDDPDLRLPSAIAVLWDFGDGATATGALTPTHTYTDNGTFTVTLTLTDTQGAVGTDTLVLSVENLAPTLAALSNQSVETGETVAFTAAFTDPGALDTHTAVIDWGDGTVEAGTVDASGGTVSGSHAYTAAGMFTVTVTLTDDDGGTVVQTFTVTVTEPPVSEYRRFLPIITR